MDKIKLRNKILAKNRDVSTKTRENNSKKIIKNILNLIKDDDISIALFYPMPTEPNILSLLEHLLSLGKRVSLPIIKSIKNREMIFSVFKSVNELKKDKFDILAPQKIELITKFDIVIVPSVGINKNFKRLGMGGGFYDTYFSNINAKFITPIYEKNMNLDFQEDAWDITIDFIVTQNRIYSPE